MKALKHTHAWRWLVLVGALAGLLVAVSGASASATTRVKSIGISDETSDMFTNPHLNNLLGQLGTGSVRLVLPWDVHVHHNPRERYWNNWLNAAHAQHYDILVVFSRSDARHGRNARIPSSREYYKAVRTFVKQHPYVQNYCTWNEANLSTQEMAGRPQTVASYYKELRKAAAGRRVMVTDLVAAPPIRGRLIPAETYARRVNHVRGVNGRLWGLHDYTDAGRHQTTWTRRAMHGMPGEVWLDETGGMVHRPRPGSGPYKYAYSVNAQYGAMRYLFTHLATIHRVTRVYIYEFINGSNRRDWDSALLRPERGSTPEQVRPAYGVVQAAVNAAAHHRRYR